MKVSVIQQVSVFMENRPGGLAELMEVLGRAEINVKAFSIAEAGDFGIVRIVVDEAENGVDDVSATLRNAGYTVSVTEVLVVEVADFGELHRVAEKPGEAV